MPPGRRPGEHGTPDAPLRGDPVNPGRRAAGNPGRMSWTCRELVTYTSGHGRGVQGARRSDPQGSPGPVARARRADAQGARVRAPDDPVRRHEAPAGARGGGSRHDEAPWPGEAPVPEPRPDQAHPRPVGKQIRRALGRCAQRAQARPRRGGMMDRYLVVDGAGTMSVFEIYIKTTPERLWEAITDPEMRATYSFGVRTDSDWSEGSPYVSGVPGVVDIAEGENVEVDPPRRLVQSMTALWSDDVKAVGTSRVTWEIEPVGTSCRLTVTHDQ